MATLVSYRLEVRNVSYAQANEILIILLFKVTNWAISYFSPVTGAIPEAVATLVGQGQCQAAARRVTVRIADQQAGSVSGQLQYTATDGGPSTSANHCWTPSIRCARPHGLELSTGRPLRTAGLRVLQTGSENLAFLETLACSAHQRHRDFRDNRAI